MSPNHGEYDCRHSTDGKQNCRHFTDEPDCHHSRVMMVNTIVVTQVMVNTIVVTQVMVNTIVVTQGEQTILC